MARRTGSHAGINGTVTRKSLKAAQPVSDAQLLSNATKAAAINSHNLSQTERDFLVWREQRRKERGT